MFSHYHLHCPLCPSAFILQLTQILCRYIKHHPLINTALFSTPTLSALQHRIPSASLQITSQYQINQHGSLCLNTPTQQHQHCLHSFTHLPEEHNLTSTKRILTTRSTLLCLRITTQQLTSSQLSGGFSFLFFSQLECFVILFCV